MKAVKKLSDEQKALLVQISKAVPTNLSMDDIMALGALGLIEFSKHKGFKLTKRGEKAIGLISGD